MNIGLFVTCPVDLIRPEVGFSAAKLLKQAGCKVTVPLQSCCGQVALNNGLTKEAKDLAWQVVSTFETYDYVVLPSGSCGGTIKHHYPNLFNNDSRKENVQKFCNKVYELTDFLYSKLGWKPDTTNCDLSNKQVVYHDSCAGLREMKIYSQPRALLENCCNVHVSEMEETEVCCGFGGTFCMKHPEIASRMADNKLENASVQDPDYLVGGDVSCLLHLSGRWEKNKKFRSVDKQPEFRHIAELLAGDLETPPINKS